MRAYLPLTLNELSLAEPPNRPAVFATPSPALTSEETEEVLEDALGEASYESLELVHQSGAAPARVVAAGSADPAVGHFESWDQAQSLMVDGPEAQGLIAKLLAATDQGEVNSLIDAVFDHPLAWHDASERGALVPTN